MSVDIWETSWDQCRSMVQYSFTSTETVRLVRTDSPGTRPPRLSHNSSTPLLRSTSSQSFILPPLPPPLIKPSWVTRCLKPNFLPSTHAPQTPFAPSILLTKYSGSKNPPSERTNNCVELLLRCCRTALPLEQALLLHLCCYVVASK